MKRSCVIYDSWGELFCNLPDETAGKLIKTISEYCFKGKTHTTDPVIDAMFSMIKIKLDEDARAWEEVKRQRSESGKKGMEKRWHSKTITNDNNVITNDNTVKQSITNITVSDSVSVSVSDKDKKIKRFIKPTLEEIRDYCKERGNNVSPEQFFDFYESKGWKVGNQSMKDWKAAVRTWEKRETESPVQKKIHSFSERSIDYAALQREVSNVQS